MVDCVALVELGVWGFNAGAKKLFYIYQYELDKKDRDR
jgi:hypothetical protein